ncbi:MAG: hypothetical protein USCGTAYLOR_02254 [Chromatiales bacterium USCg_Taylor]|nr:hypothetical protein [Gammaproteobacteria bacterium]OOO01533.1 MAG: hypothetical protein USCGTAYLOR_02254 [Chromatiales bacterium USCg_Taylor]
MTETENLVLEQLRAIRGRLDRVDEKLGFMDSRLIAVEQHLAALVAMIPASNDRFRVIESRIERIERRLELTDG